MTAARRKSVDGPREVGMLTRLKAHVCGLIPPFDDKNCITFTFWPIGKEAEWSLRSITSLFAYKYLDKGKHDFWDFPFLVGDKCESFNRRLLNSEQVKGMRFHSLNCNK